jgi:hypothetical protein
VLLELTRAKPACVFWLVFYEAWVSYEDTWRFITARAWPHLGPIPDRAEAIRTLVGIGMGTRSAERWGRIRNLRVTMWVLELKIRIRVDHAVAPAELSATALP